MKSLSRSTRVRLLRGDSVPSHLPTPTLERGSKSAQMHLVNSYERSGRVKLLCLHWQTSPPWQMGLDDVYGGVINKRIG